MELVEITDLGTPANPHPDLLAGLDLWERWSLGTFDHNDFQYAASEHLAMAASPNKRHDYWIVREGGRAVGWLELGIPLHDNLHLGELEVGVEPGLNSAPVLDLLWGAASARLHELGRRTAALWWETPVGAPGLTGTPDRLRPETGAGSVPRDAMAVWLLDHGFVLEQVERASLLELPAADLDTLEAEASAASAAAYDVVTWTGRTPPELEDRLAHLRARMSVDIPNAGLDVEMERWDAARIRSDDALVEKMGRTPVWAVALERASGEAVGHTLLVCPPANPEVAFQEDTLVLTAHRGHRLGQRLKVANLRQLARVRPGVRRVRTWNADENAWMLAINERLGFRPDADEGSWQARLSDAAPTLVG